jgi:hypothetical protein
LRGARGVGVPGTVRRLRRGKVVVRWHDLGHTSAHRPNTLFLAEAFSVVSSDKR